MIRVMLLGTALLLASCGQLRIEPTPSPTVFTHSDPVPANPSGEWDATLVIEPPVGLASRPVPVADAVTYADGTDVAVLGVLFVDTAYLETWLCEELVEEETPQCGGVVLLVEGLDEAAMAGWQFRSSANVRWLEGVALAGRIERR